MRELEHGRDWVFVNAIDIEDMGEGLIPLRFERRHLARMGEMAKIARMATSVELQLRGSFAKVEVDVKTNFSDGFGEAVEWYWGPYMILPHAKLGGAGTVATLSLDVAGWRKVGGQHPLRLLFPTHCEVQVLAVRAEGEATPAASHPPFDYRQLPGALGLRWLAHGDSITQGANCSAPTLTWVDIAARTLGVKAVNLAIGGHGKAEPVIAEALAARDDFDFLSLHVGANASDLPLFLDNLSSMLRTVRAAHPSKLVFVASPILAMAAEGVMEPKVAKTREAMESLLGRLAASDPNLRPLRGLELLGDGLGMNVDFVHLNDFGFMRYAANAVALMRRDVEERSQESGVRIKTGRQGNEGRKAE